MAKLHIFANSGNPDLMLHYATSDLGLQFSSYHFRGLQTKMGLILGDWIHFQERKLGQKIFFLPFEKGSILKGHNLLPLEQIPSFQSRSFFKSGKLRIISSAEFA